MAGLINTKTLDVPVGLSLNSLVGIFPTETDPSVSGLDLPVGSMALHTAGKVWKKSGSGATDWTELEAGSGGGFDPAKTVIVAKTGGDYTSVKSALDYAATQSPSVTNPWTVVVYPGVYAEDAMTVPNYCNLVSAGGLGSAIITPNSSTATVITCGAYSEIYGLFVTGASGTGGIGIKSTSMQSLVRSCTITNCETAVLFSGSGAICIAQDLVIVRTPGTVLGTAVRIESGARATVQAATISGTSISVITSGVIITGSGTRCTVSAIEVTYCTTGVLVDSNAYGVLSTVAANNCTTGYSFTGTNTVAPCNACAARNCTTSINIGSATVRGYYRGSADSETVTRTSGNDKFFIDIVTFQAGEEGFEFAGNTSVGTHKLPSRFTAGSGHATVEEQHVFTNTNGEAGTWNDLTATNNDPDTTYTLFAGTGAGNCVYIGVEAHEYHSLLIQGITTAVVYGSGSVQGEYWNGTAWTPFHIMVTKGKDQYAQRALRDTGDENIHFGHMQGWTTKTLNGQSAYWARYRIVSAITTAPVLARMEHYLDSAVIEYSGYLEFHGEAQPKRIIPLSLMTDIQGFNSSNVPLKANANTYLVVENNDRDNNRKDGSGGTLRIPAGLNTAKPITFHILFAPLGPGAGNVENDIYLANISAGVTLNGAVTELGPVGDIVAVPANSTNKIFESEHAFDIQVALPNETYIWSLIRDATSGNPDDTLGEATYIAAWTCEGTFWR